MGFKWHHTSLLGTLLRLVRRAQARSDGLELLFGWDFPECFTKS